MQKINKETLIKKENNNLSDDINARIITNTRLMFNDENFNDYPLNKLDTLNKLPNDIQTEILQNKFVSEFKPFLSLLYFTFICIVL